MQNSPYISFCYPTYKRPGRVSRLIEYYSQYRNPRFEVVISNNDPSTSLVGQFPKLPGNIRIVDSPYKPNRIGNNIHNCLLEAKSQYAILLSDEDVLIGVEELINFLHLSTPDIVSIKLIEDRYVCREKPRSEFFGDFIFNCHGNLSGIGFAKQVLSHVDLNRLLLLENNDYYHILLMIMLIDGGASYVFTDKSVIYREVLTYEKDFLAKRREWFFIEGRLAQDKSFDLISRDLGNPALRRYIKDVRGRDVLNAVSGSFLDYGIAETVSYLLKQRHFRLLLCGTGFYLRELVKKTIYKAGRVLRDKGWA